MNFAWYYFDLHCSDGYDLILTWHVQPFQTVFPITIFDLFVYHKGQKLFHKFVSQPLGSVVSDSQKTIISAPGLVYKMEAEQYSVAADQPGFRLNFRLKRNLAATERHFELLPVTGADSFHWKLFEALQPAGCELETEGRKYNFSGQGYHDYNGGNINLKKVLSHWHWSKLLYSDHILVLGEVVDRKHNRRQVAVSSASETVSSFRENEQNIQITTAAGSSTIQIERSVELDNVRFYMAASRSAWLPWQKLREVGAVLSATKKMPAFIHHGLSNVVYRRFRQQARDESGREISIFREEIQF